MEVYFTYITSDAFKPGYILQGNVRATCYQCSSTMHVVYIKVNCLLDRASYCHLHYIRDFVLGFVGAPPWVLHRWLARIGLDCSSLGPLIHQETP
jgi:hypothetical protein